jgi:hypothetical protein
MKSYESVGAVVVALRVGKIQDQGKLVMPDRHILGRFR